MPTGIEEAEIECLVELILPNPLGHQAQRKHIGLSTHRAVTGVFVENASPAPEDFVDLILEPHRWSLTSLNEPGTGLSDIRVVWQTLLLCHGVGLVYSEAINSAI